MKTVIITGAGGNLGKATVKKFLDSGYNVVATTRHENELTDFKGIKNFEAQIVNAGNEQEAEDFVNGIIKKNGGVHAALMLIGGYAGGTIENTGDSELQKMFSLNFNTAYFIARPVFRQMLKQPDGGRLIFIASAPAIEDREGYPMIGYTLAKSLVYKLAKVLNSEGKKKNIQCAVIAPTTIDTPENRISMPNANFEAWTKPEDIAGIMELICSVKGDKMKDVVLKM